MEPIQPQQRRVADQVFQQSLDQLEDILQEISTEEEEIPQLHTTNLSEIEVDQDLIAIDLAALEDAVADIEQYLEEKTKTQEKS
jgi:outer membrane usher protein FimD/PapC